MQRPRSRLSNELIRRHFPQLAATAVPRRGVRSPVKPAPVPSLTTLNKVINSSGGRSPEFVKSDETSPLVPLPSHRQRVAGRNHSGSDQPLRSRVRASTEKPAHGRRLGAVRQYGCPALRDYRSRQSAWLRSRAGGGDVQRGAQRGRGVAAARRWCCGCLCLGRDARSRSDGRGALRALRQRG